MQMEHRIVSVHRCDRVGIVLGPGAAVFLCDINQALAHASLLRVLKEMNSLCGRQTAGIEAPPCGYDVGPGYLPSLASNAAGVRIGPDSDKARMSWSPLTRMDALLSAIA